MEVINGKLNLRSKADNVIKKHILHSWQRCIELGVTRDEIHSPLNIGLDKIGSILDENRNLINISLNFMNDLYSFVKNTGFVIMLTDKNGVLLNVVGDKMIIEDEVEGYDYQIGTIWNEKNVGNTAISSVLYEKKALQVLGEEHYCKRFKMWACSGAPIKYGNEVIAVLSARGNAQNTHSHTLGMVMATANAIENQLRLEKANNEILYKNKCQSAIMECIDEGFLTVDNKGILTYINKTGANILGIKQENAVGKHVRSLVDFEPVILEVLKTGKGYVDKEFVIKSNNTDKNYHFLKTAIPIMDNEGKIVGVLDKFSQMKKFNKMMRNFVGNYGKFTFESIISESPKMAECINLAKIAAKSGSRVLINGESGTGKELLVQSIHNASDRKKESLVSINCAAIPRELIESELFGYERGAFTGALKDGQIGKFELANGGTIFLDEIGDMPLHMQGKLLRVLQENQITRVGGRDNISVDARVICSTNKDLLLECKKGNFREDLYYRLNVFNIVCPPLRDRKEDIKILTDYFIRKFNSELSSEVIDISSEALAKLIDYDWPGNVRELENIIERAVNLCTDNTINVKDLPSNVTDYFTEKIKTFTLEEDKFSTIYSMPEIEKKAIERTLNILGGNITQAAKVLKISRNTLYSKIDKYNIS